MNSELRREVFCIIVGAHDVMECYHELVSLGLNKEKRKEIVNVLFHCVKHVRRE